MGGRSCKPWRVLDPVIPSGVLGPEAGDTVWNCFRPPVDSADRPRTSYDKGGALLGIVLGGLK